MTLIPNEEQKTLLLTGASRGIGHATVKRFSSAGWRVISCSRHPFQRTVRGRRARRTTSRSISPTKTAPSARSPRSRTS